MASRVTTMASIAAALTLLCLLQTSLADVISCGGFVKTLEGVDKSKIRVRLLTSEGNQKRETECNPVTGYYMIPIYNKGTYKFQVVAPDGYIFEDDQRQYVIDGKTDPCTAGGDINFQQIGYTISGKVVTGDAAGPSGFKLGLYTPDGKLVSKVDTDASGNYRFNAAPGKYVVYNVDDGAQCIERGKVPVVVTNAPVVVQPDITISGHLLTVRVRDEKGNKLSGATVKLFTKKLINNANDGLVGKQVTGGYVYTAKTSASGASDFPCLPPGEYVITPSFAANGVSFSFEPTSNTFTMKSENSEVVFAVSGFSTAGAVKAAGKPIVGASVLLNGKVVAETDAQGSYQLKNVKSGSVKLTAQKKDLEFTTHSIELTPSKPALPVIEVAKVSVCGIVHVDQNQLRGASISYKSSTGSIQTASVDDRGSFCFAVAPGKYEVRAVGVPPVTPEVFNVDVAAVPVHNVFFTQFKAKVDVSIQTLAGFSGYEVVLTSDQGKIVGTQPAASKVQFVDVPPGGYSLSVKGTPSCWEKEELQFQIRDSDVSNVHFKQTGYKIVVNTDYPVSLSWTSASKKNGGVQINPKESSFCVPFAEEYTATLLACHVFDQPTFKFSAPSTVPIKLVAKEARVTVLAKTPTKANENFKLLIRSDGHSDETVQSVITDGSQKFTFKVDLARAGSSLYLTPKSATYLFEPANLDVQFDGNCNEGNLVFNAKKGEFIQGKVQPFVDDVTVIATKKSDPSTILSVGTENSGSFSIGPLENAADYDLEVEKEGYKFIREAGNVYKAVKLSELRVKFIDSVTKEPLGEVLASISGIDNYRSNKVIGASGTQNYIGLRPGEYYIVGHLQEYVFENTPVKIVVKEGEIVTATLEGKRFAYSVFGKLTYLDGQAIPNVRIEALSRQCGNLQEDDVTKEDGSYRIRGLKADCEYKITPKPDNQANLPYPPFVNTVVKKEDRRNVNFMISRAVVPLDIFGKINFPTSASQPLSTKVSLWSQKQRIQTVNVIKPDQLFIFSVPYHLGDAYTVIVEDPKTKKIHTVELDFTVNNTVTSLSIDVTERRKSSDVTISFNNYIGIVLFGILVFAVLQPEKVRPIFDKLIVQGRTLKTIVESTTNSNQYAETSEQDSNVRHRKSRKN
uniref:Carboxypeptidase regulatory-like domain-containing protein n=1 Tax=Panagrellus redivivus TaxID=6233 RepID=A0A7E4W2T9_PANRE